MKIKVKELKNIIAEATASKPAYFRNFLMFKDENGKRCFGDIVTLLYKDRKPRSDDRMIIDTIESGFSERLKAKIKNINFHKAVRTAWDNSPEYASMAQNRTATMKELISMLKTQLGPEAEVFRLSEKKYVSFVHQIRNAQYKQYQQAHATSNKRITVYVVHEREGYTGIMSVDNTGEVKTLYAPKAPRDEYEYDEWKMFAESFDEEAYYLSDTLEGVETYEDAKADALSLGAEVISAEKAKMLKVKLTKQFGKSGGHPNV